VPGIPRWVRHGFVFAMGLACPGLGQLYSGRPLRAILALLLTMFVILPGSRILAYWLSWSPLTMIAGILVGGAMLLPVPIDGVLQARNRRVTIWSSWWICTLGGALALTLLAFELLALPGYLPLRQYRIPTNAMYPNVLAGDVVVVDMRRATIDRVRPGDIVVFENPADPNTLWLHRVAGMAGDQVAIDGGLLVIDGERKATVGADRHYFTERLGSREYQVWLELGYIPDLSPSPIRVSGNRLFLLGDNRHNTRDSRSYGLIDIGAVRGRLLRVRWSFDSDANEYRWERFGTEVR